MTTTTSNDFDLVVIGGGPGGYAAALYAASAGMSVAVVEKEKVGGTCLLKGCVPTKEFLETASVYRTVANAKEFGVEAGQPTVDFSVSQDRKQKVVDHLQRGLSGLMRSRGIEILQGKGTLSPSHKVRISSGEEITGRYALLASGSVPRSIPGFDIDGKTVMTSDELLSLTELPASAVVIGGGAIGCEFASFLSDLGVHITILEALPKILAGCDSDVVTVVARSFRKRGIDVKTNVKVHGHRPNEKGKGTTVVYGQGEELDVDVVVVSVGRRPYTEGLLTPGTGVSISTKGFVEVDSKMRATAEGVWAVGDLVDTPQLAHVGFAEAIVAVRDMLGEDVVPVDYTKVPWCIYCHPEVAFVGLTEEAALSAGYEVVVKKDPLGGNSRARILGETDGLVKVVAERGHDGRAGRVLGVHMVGPWVTEQLGQAYLSVNWEAIPEEIAQFIQPHPTLSEAFGETMLAMTGRGLHVG